MNDSLAHNAHVSRATQCSACSLVHLNPLGQCSKHRLDTVSESKANQHLVQGQYLYTQGSISQGIYCVHKGYLLLEKNIGTNKYPIKFCKEGDLLGLAAMFGTPTHNHTIVAITNVDVCFIDSTSAWELFEKEPAFNKQVMNSLVSDLNLLEGKTSVSLFLNAEQRIADVLTMAQKSIGVSPEGMLLQSIEFTHLADWCNVSFKTIAQICSAWASKGGIVVEKQCVVAVLDTQKLK
jgi:CRP-like cAMP-binding protein